MDTFPWPEDEGFDGFDLYNHIESYDHKNTYVFKSNRVTKDELRLKVTVDDWVMGSGKIVKIKKMSYRHLMSAYRVTGDTRLRDEIIYRFSKGLKELGEKNDTLSSQAKASD